ncbi:MAG: hypothetical protein AAGC73_00950, partial [Verrucomicrobiota bacterium]
LLVTYLAVPLQAIVLDLDFSNINNVNYRGPQQSLVLRFNDVETAPDLDIRIESQDAYIPESASAGNNQNGSVGDDLKMHIDSGETTLFRFFLYNADTTTLYDPGVDFSFDFVIYDLDGDVTNSRGASQVTFYTPLTYTVTSATTLNISQDSSSITFTGTAGSLAGNEGITSFANTNQENAAVGIVIENTSQFDFAIGAPNNGIEDGGRNILFDPNDLTVTGTPINFVPEPGSYALWAGLLVLFAACRRSR